MTDELGISLGETIESQLEEPWATPLQRVNDWRNYVNPDLRKIWPLLTLRERRIIAFLGHSQAMEEEWD